MNKWAVPLIAEYNLGAFVSILVIMAGSITYLWRTKVSLSLPDYFKLSGVPPPKPLWNFNIEDARPRPYRPFRLPYHQTMALLTFEPDWWLELESTYKARIVQRIEIYNLHTTAVLDSMPGSESACRELMEMCIQWLCMRYPRLFRYDQRSGVFWNDIRKMHFDTRALHPLHFLLQNVPEDFAVMLEDTDTGLYHLRAGVLISAIGWNLREKLGKPIHEIHEHVPHKEKIEGSINRYFSKVESSKPIQRGSWGFEVGQPLYLQTDDAHWAVRATQDPALRVADVHLRVDWQTLRRLPCSRAIVFNFKALFTPLSALREEPYVPRLVATILRQGPAAIMQYKNTRHIEHVVLPALDAWAAEQEDNGRVPRGWKPRTLDENPFFPGWEHPFLSAKCYS